MATHGLEHMTQQLVDEVNLYLKELHAAEPDLFKDVSEHDCPAPSKRLCMILLGEIAMLRHRLYYEPSNAAGISQLKAEVAEERAKA